MLFYFIIGILFIDVALPLLESITGCICTRMEQYKAKCAVKINEYNAEIEAVDIPVQAHPIGFQYTSEDDFEGEYND